MLELRTCFYAVAVCRASDIYFAPSPCRAFPLIFPMAAPSKSAVPMVAPLLFLAKTIRLIAISATIIFWPIISSARAPCSTPMATRYIPPSRFNFLARLGCSVPVWHQVPRFGPLVTRFSSAASCFYVPCVNSAPPSFLKRLFCNGSSIMELPPPIFFLCYL